MDAGNGICFGIFQCGWQYDKKQERSMFYLPARIPRGFAPGMNGGETNFSDRVAKRSAGIRRGSAPA